MSYDELAFRRTQRRPREERLNEPGRIRLNSVVGLVDWLRALSTQRIRETTGSIAAAGASSVIVTWPEPFDDTNYTMAVEIEVASGLRVERIESRTAADATIRVVNDDGGAAHTGTLHCIGWAD